LTETQIVNLNDSFDWVRTNQNTKIWEPILYRLGYRLSSYSSHDPDVQMIWP